MKVFNKDIKKHQIIILIAIISFVIELVLLGYYSIIDKLFISRHLIGNTTTIIEKEALNFIDEPDEWGYKYIEYENEIENVYNIELIMKETNNDAYIRVLYEDTAEVMKKSDKEQRVFKAYFNGKTLKNFKIAYYQDEILPGNIEEIKINDNIDYNVSPRFSIVRVLAVFIAICMIYGMILVIKNIEKKEVIIKKENLFLILGAITGISMCFANVVLSKYDEHAHFWRAYEISDGTIVSGHSEGLPTSIFDLVINDEGIYEIEDNASYKDQREDFNIQLNPEELTYRLVGASGGVSPISYMPQIIGITIARILKLNPTIIVFAGRIANLLYYILLIYLAIKILPKEKWKNILLIVSLLPMSINLAASLSPDSVIISTTILAIAYLLKIKFRENKVRIKDTIIIGILFMIPFMCKIVYLPLSLLFMMIPKELFKSNKQKWLYFGIVIAIEFAFWFLWHLVPAPNAEVIVRTNPIEQLYFTLSDPIRDLGTLGNTIWYNTEGYIETMIGGWNTPHSIIAIFTIILLLFTFEDTEKNKSIKFSKSERLFMTFICLSIMLLIYAGLYVTWTKAQSTIADGIQGRYFLPILFMIMLIFDNNKIKFKFKNLDLKLLTIIIILYVPIIVNTVQYFNK
ncbi:MAG: DUF2142 domain-containing protein [Clostridia bacterium]|nr:DUF2142 domain-containing protein [Clostridia bacterium]